MMDEKESFKNLKVSQAEFLERLFFSGHIVQKITFVLSFGFFCFLVGFGSAKIVLRNEKQPVALSRNEAAKNEAAKKEEVIESTSAQADEAKNPQASSTRAPASDDFYFTIRVGSAIDESEAKEMIKKYSSECQDINFKFSDIHRRFLIYCGRFDDIYSARTASEKLNTSERIIVRKSPTDSI